MKYCLLISNSRHKCIQNSSNFVVSTGMCEYRNINSSCYSTCYHALIVLPLEQKKLSLNITTHKTETQNNWTAGKCDHKACTDLVLISFSFQGAKLGQRYMDFSINKRVLREELIDTLCLKYLELLCWKWCALPGCLWYPMGDITYRDRQKQEVVSTRHTRTNAIQGHAWCHQTLYRNQ